MFTNPDVWLALALGYALGALPFGVILTRLAGAGDLSHIGSGNIGATNVLRTGRKGLAISTLLLDMGKGALAVVLARYLFDRWGFIAGLGAFMGHLFPLWLKFRGGKGVATFFGVLLAFAPVVGGLTAATWIVTATLSRISSLAALVASLAAVGFQYWVRGTDAAVITAIMTLLIVIKHRDNIARLLKGAEPKIGQS